MSGLMHGFNQYLVYGFEFEQHVAYSLLEKDGLQLLSVYGKPKIVKVAVPGELALKAAHPFFTLEDMRDRESVPNIVREFLTSWSYRASNPDFQSRRLKVDCGMIFRTAVPATWIVDITPVEIPVE